MFYYKNKFGPLDYILQCLFIYNTIILNDMTSWIDRISNNTLTTELPSGPTPCILFYQNSYNFIMRANSQQDVKYKIKMEEIGSEVNEDENKLVKTSFIKNISNKNYKYMLYISNPNNLDMVYGEINEIITNNIQPIISSKVNK